MRVFLHVFSRIVCSFTFLLCLLQSGVIERDVETLQGILSSNLFITVLNDHPQSGMVYKFGPICMSVRRLLLKALNILCRKFIFARAAYRHGLRVKFVYEGHRVKVKVTGAKKVGNSYSCNVKL